MKLHSIQYLRAVAAVLVVLCHASTTLFRREKVLVNLEFGAYGVDIFFVVSGFIMLYTSHAGPRTPGDFLIRRLIRIFPLYFVLSTLLFFLVLWVVPESDTASADIPSYVKSVLFIPHWNPKLHNLQPLIGQGWSLNYEMFFYALFTVGLFVAERVRALVVITCISLLALGGALYGGSNPFLLTYINPMMMEFCLGLLVAQAFISGTRQGARRWEGLIPALLLFAIAAAGVIALTSPSASAAVEPRRFLLIGLPSAAVVLLFVRLEGLQKMPEWTGVQRIGDASYSLYLSHTFVLAACRRLWQRCFDITTLFSHVAFIVLSTAVSIAVALALYRFVEKPLTQLLTRAWERVRSRRPSPAVLTPP